MTVHVFIERRQPATKYKVQLDDETITITNPAKRTIIADCCQRRRIARNLTVQVYYDCHRYQCADGKGCRMASQAKGKR